MAPTDREWRLVPEEARSGATNMALDAVAAETVAAGGPRTLRVYRWEPSTLSLGYGQAAASVDWAYCEAEGIDVVRRPTGGGGIYHDAVGDVSYSIVVPADEVPGDLLASYELLLEPVVDAFERMGVDARVARAAQPPIHEPACYLRAIEPAHDLVVDGRKVSGNAQYRQREAVIQHGSITYASEPQRHLGVFADPAVDVEAFEGRVTSVREQSGIERGAAVEALENALGEWAGAREGGWSDDELERADEVAAERFADEVWTRRR